MKKLIFAMVLALGLTSCSSNQSNNVSIETQEVPGFNVQNFAALAKTTTNASDIETEVTSIVSNIATTINGNKSTSISFNSDNINNGGIIATNSVTILENNLNFKEISYNVGNQLTQNTFNASYSSVKYNTFANISSNANSNILSNTVRDIVFNNVNLINNNNLVDIRNNSNLYCISNSAGTYICGVTGYGSSFQIKLNQLKNADIYQIGISADVQRHTFLDDMRNISLTPSNNMRFTTYSTVSRYLFDLSAHFEEISNSTGLTWSGPIA